jgi:hypothetical protein
MTLCWRQFSEWGSDKLASYFAYKGYQYNGYTTSQLNHFTITLLTSPEIVEPQLTLSIKMWLGACSYDITYKGGHYFNYV